MSVTPDSSPALLPPLRDSIAGIESSQIVALWQAGLGRADLIPLYIGEGDTATPRLICDAAHRAMLDGHTFYSPKRGIPELRQALAGYMGRHFGVDHFGSGRGSERITVTTAGMNAIMLALQTTLSRGDKLAVVTPCWPNVMGAARIVDAEPAPFAMDPLGDGRFTLDLERLFAHCRETAAKALFLVSPSNPTGWIITPEEQAAILEFCRREGIWLIADEVYHRFVFDGRAVAPSFLQVAEEEDPLFVVNSFSKAWAMTGWRLGWLTHPRAIGPVLNDLVEFNTSGSQAFIHKAALAGLSDAGEAWVEGYVEQNRQGAEVVFQRLAAMPRVRIARPAGSFYAFFAVEGLDDSFGFCQNLLAETGVGLAPGSAFGPGGEGHIRLCFATDHARLAEAMARIAPYLA